MPTPSPTQSYETPVEYRNSELGFSLSLPTSWQGFFVIISEWQGMKTDPLGENVVERGLVISIIHPLATEQQPRQNIPILIFSVEQWNHLLKGDWHIGAAPINPSELGRNNVYVFALPARYNYALQEGWEEVEKILQTRPLHTFPPKISP